MGSGVHMNLSAKHTYTLVLAGDLYIALIPFMGGAYPLLYYPWAHSLTVSLAIGSQTLSMNGGVALSLVPFFRKREML
jgi:hypothetical protein